MACEACGHFVLSIAFLALFFFCFFLVVWGVVVVVGLGIEGAELEKNDGLIDSVDKGAWSWRGILVVGKLYHVTQVWYNKLKSPLLWRFQ